jgi:uncharacterized membrane protein YkoI
MKKNTLPNYVQIRSSMKALSIAVVASTFMVATPACVEKKNDTPTTEQKQSQQSKSQGNLVEKTEQHNSGNSNLEVINAEPQKTIESNEVTDELSSFEVPDNVLVDAKTMVGGRIVQATGSQQAKVDTWVVILQTEDNKRVQLDYFRVNDQVFTIQGDGVMPEEKFSEKFGITSLANASKKALDTLGGRVDKWVVKNTGAGGWYYVITVAQADGSSQRVKIGGKDGNIIAVQEPEPKKGATMGKSR